MMSRRILLLMAAVVGWGSLAGAALTTWDADTGTAGSQDGTGSWDTASVNWWNGAADQAWSSSDTAVFGSGSGTAGTVTVGTVTANGIIFNAAGSGNYALSGGTLTLGGATITTNANATISSSIAGTVGLTKAGTGMLTLAYSTESALTGSTTINAGVLEIGSTARLYNSTAYNTSAVVTVNTGGTLRLVSWGYGSVGGLGAISAYSNQRILAGGTFEVTGNSHSSGCDFRTTALGGTFRYTPSGQTLTLSDNVNDNLRLGGALTVDAVGNIIINEVIQDNTTAGSIIKTGAATLTLTGASSYTGGTAVNAGTLQVTPTAVTGASMGTGSVTVNTGATLNIWIQSNANSTFNYANSFVFNDGTTVISRDGDTHFATGAGATIAVNGTVGFTRWWGYGGTGKKACFDGIMQGTGTLNLYGGSGTTEGGGLLVGNNANTYSGTINVINTTSNSICLIAGGNSALQYATVNLNGTNTGTPAYALRFNTGVVAPVVGGLTGSGNVLLQDLASTAVALTVNTSGATSYGGILSGTGSLVKAGTGTVTLTGANSYTGGTTITGGTLTLSGGANRLSSSGPLAFGNIAGATLDLNGQAQTVASLSGGGAAGGNIALGAGALTVNQTSATSYGGAISGTGGLTKSGSGTLTLSGANLYSGSTSVNGGVLAVTGSLPAAGGVSVANGAKLGGTGSVGNVTVASGGILDAGVSGSGTLTLNSLTLGTVAGDTATINIGVASGATSSKLQVNGNVTANGGAGKVTFAFGSNLAFLNTGTYPLLSYTGAQLADTTAFTYSGTAGARATINIVNGAQAVDLGISNAWPIWTGLASSDWSAATGNWKLNTDSSGTAFIANDTVVFDDSATGGSTTVNLSANVNPLSTTFSHSILTYTLQSTGGFGITTGSLVKSGTGTLTISNANSYAGGTTISAGTVIIGNGGAFGSGAVALNGGTLNINGQTLANAVVMGGGAVTGAGTLSGVVSGSGALAYDSAGNTLRLTNTNTYSGGTTVNAGSTLQMGDGTASNGVVAGNIVNAGALVFANPGAQSYSGAISGAGSVKKSGAGTLTLSGASSFNGGLTIAQGIVSGTSAGAFGASGNLVTVQSGGTLDLAGINRSANVFDLNVIGSGVASGGAVYNSGAAISGNSGVRNVTLAGDATFTVGGSTTEGNRWDLISAGTLNMAGHKLTKTGAGNMTIHSTPGTAGAIDIVAGTVSFEDNFTGAATTGYTVNVQAGAAAGAYNGRTVNAAVTLTGTNAAIYSQGSTRSV